MSKSYIVETDDETQLIVEIGVNSTGAALIATNPVSYLTPYTEPDLEQVRKEAHDAALDDLWEAMQKAIKMYCEIDNEVFLRVFHDVKCDRGESVLQALFKNTPQHLIDSIRKYEQAKEEKQHTWIFSEVNEPSVDTTLICSKCGYTITIKPGDTQSLNFCPKCGDCKKPKEEIQVGDEVETVAGKAVIIEVLGNGKNVHYWYPDASTGFDHSCNVTRTGRNFPEIAEVLKKMQGEEE